MSKYEPYIFVAVLVKQKAEMLPAWLDHLTMWDYPKDKIILYIRTNNNTDDTDSILNEFVDEWRNDYSEIVENQRDVEERVQDYGVHEWNPTRFRVLAQIREESVQMAMTYDLAKPHYFVCDVDNFIKPDTLRKLVETRLPVVAPLLRSADIEQPAYSNYHNFATHNGYFLENRQYYDLLQRKVTGLIQCDVVHCTYLIRNDVLKDVRYHDGTTDYEYVIFSRNLRADGIPQYLDNRELYGYLTTREKVKEVTTKWKELL